MYRAVHLDGLLLGERSTLAEAQRLCDKHEGRACVIHGNAVVHWAPETESGSRLGALAMTLRLLGVVRDACGSYHRGPARARCRAGCGALATRFGMCIACRRARSRRPGTRKLVTPV